MSLMKAIRIHSYGPAEVLSLEEGPVPVPHQGEILVRVRTAGVNPVDWKTRRGEGAAGMVKRPFPLTLGWDFAGHVAALGPGVAKFTEGDAVFGMLPIPDEGSYADYVVIRAEHATFKPETLTMDQAAAVPLAALTTWQALFGAAQLKAGQTVLIHAAAGGVGHIAVQLAKAEGATVLATASAANHDFVRFLGASTVIDYSRERFEDHARDVDVVFDTVGGETQTRSFAVLRRGGTLVSILNPPDPRQAQKHEITARWIFVQPNSEQLRKLGELIDGGHLFPTVSQVYSMGSAQNAHREGEKGHTRGKAVLRISSAQQGVEKPFSGGLAARKDQVFQSSLHLK